MSICQIWPYLTYWNTSKQSVNMAIMGIHGELMTTLVHCKKELRQYNVPIKFYDQEGDLTYFEISLISLRKINKQKKHIQRHQNQILSPLYFLQFLKLKKRKWSQNFDFHFINAIFCHLKILFENTQNPKLLYLNEKYVFMQETKNKYYKSIFCIYIVYGSILHMVVMIQDDWFYKDHPTTR